MFQQVMRRGRRWVTRGHQRSTALTCAYSPTADICFRVIRQSEAALFSMTSAADRETRRWISAFAASGGLAWAGMLGALRKGLIDAIGERDVNGSKRLLAAL